MPNDRAPKTFVLVHGVWHGGWCWQRVEAILRARGHRVTAPTQTGLGERSHLLSKDITMAVFVEDIVNHLRWDDLTDVILVGHSFGGAPITGAADKAPDLISQLIYLDGAVMEDGETWFGLLPPDIAEARKKTAETFSGGVSLPAAPVESFGVTEPDDVAFVAPRLTPHPLATFSTPLTLNGPIANGVPASYITCTDPAYVPAKLGLERVRDAGWPVAELATGHDAMITAPVETADLLEQLSSPLP
ncbi:MAG: alpha/beta fold hydrolase [Pseudomonadota bacterium]